MLVIAAAACAWIVAFGFRNGPGTARAQDTPTGRPEQEVHLGVESDQMVKLNLILEEFSPGAGATSSDARRVHDVVSNDLSLTDIFNLIPGPARLATGPPPDTTGWWQLLPGGDVRVEMVSGGWPGAQFVAGAGVRVSGSDLVVEAYLKEYPSYRVVLARNYRSRPEWFREAAHRFSDDIVLYLTGQEGISRTRIAFISNQTGAKELHLIDFDGENLRQITRDKSIALSPAWKPDGSRLAFVSFRRGDPDLYQVNLSSGEITALSTKPGPDMAPAFSRDGRLAFSVTVGGNSELFVAGADGGNPRQVTKNRGIDTSPTWSPTGQMICFTSDRSGSPQLYISDQDGGNLRRLTQEGTWNDSPDWSPDGERIVYVSQSGSGFKIWTILVDGSGATALTGGAGSDENPKWSPDGRKIVFSSSREGGRALYTMNADGSGVRRLTFLKGECFGTAWSQRLPR